MKKSLQFKKYIISALDIFLYPRNFKDRLVVGTTVQAYSPSTQEAEAGGSGSRPAWAM
jgi:hypothetical protein